ncbi:DUF3489 domain-containing protein [Sphingomonas sp. LY54]|uniref:DUF3489 domain-containing protein n=1 Tax=Sphingomonas sp. LY54 TaxID=3095343 RepID=UPI002D79E089|nr:DUF3489 domain-containing protein [Sphingomonas sp. LY54]WRP29793.1 DUF3489 domain-containing protein [Sphingomonas sp. LY54]
MTEAIQISEPPKPKRTRKSAAGSAPVTACSKGPNKSTKADTVVALLSRAKGATLDDIMTATGWQSHSVRGFISGTLKKKLGRTITSEKTARGRIYRLLAGGAG